MKQMIILTLNVANSKHWGIFFYKNTSYRIVKCVSEEF